MMKRNAELRPLARALLRALATLAMLAAPAPLRAQALAAAPGAVVGQVLDAATQQPVASAVVTLEPATPGLLLDAGAAAPLTAARSVVTGASGAYRFADVAPGRYRLRIERLGYRSATVTLDVRRPTEANVSVGLEVEPVALEPVHVVRTAAALFQRAAHDALETDASREAAERANREIFVSPDARVLTYADVLDGVTLGEGDVFRALQRFPGVGTRDDYTAELWTRGAPWAHTRVTYDGVPLFNPVHAVGILSAITPEVLGAVFFHPGVRPASVGDGAAGVVDLRSRAAGGGGELRGVADLSVASSKLVLEQQVAGRGGWLVAGRRSHVHVLSGGLGRLGLDTLDLPYVFHDLAGRVDLELGGGARLEASALWEEDRIDGDLAGVLERTTARWGNAAGRLTLRHELRGLELSHTYGASRFSSRTDAHEVRRGAQQGGGWSEPASRNTIRHHQLAGGLAPASGGAPGGWAIGYEVVWQDVDYDGPQPRYHPVKPDTTGRVRYARELRVAALHADRRFAVGERLSVQPGARVEGSTELQDGGALRLAPRLAARLALSADHSVSFAAGRSWQYTQAIALAGPSIHPAFHASSFWLWPDERTPPIRTDLASLGTERWLGDGWLGSATVFARRTAGVTLPDPAPGPVAPRRALVQVEGEAHGVELGLRRVGARWSTALGYSYGFATVRHAEWSFPSPADRRHVLDAMAAARLGHGLRLAAAYTAMSGAPFTRAYSLSSANCTLLGFGCNNPRGSFVEEPNAERTPDYRSLDASLHWVRGFGRTRLGAYVQVRNLLGRDNASTYSGSTPIDRRPREGGGAEIVWDDRFERGLPRLPLAGLRLSF